MICKDCKRGKDWIDGYYCNFLNSYINKNNTACVMFNKGNVLQDIINSSICNIYSKIENKLEEMYYGEGLDKEGISKEDFAKMLVLEFNYDVKDDLNIIEGYFINDVDCYLTIRFKTPEELLKEMELEELKNKKDINICISDVIASEDEIDELVEELENVIASKVDYNGLDINI